MNRRQLIKRAAVGTGVAWVTPMIASSDAFALGSCPNGCSGSENTQILTNFTPAFTRSDTGACWFFPYPTDPNNGTATRANAGASATVCRNSATQTMWLTTSTSHTSGPYFDSVATLYVTSPLGVTTGRNYRYWQANCLDDAWPIANLNGLGYTHAAPPSRTVVVSGSQPFDITALFNSECGDFTVRLVIGSIEEPHGWNSAYVWAQP